MTTDENIALPRDEQVPVPAPRPADETAVAQASRPLAAAPLALIAVIAAVLAYRTLTANNADPDMFWHLAAGRWIVQHAALPPGDVFSWYGIENGSRWLMQEWLSEVVYYAVYALGGFGAVYAFVTVLGATIASLVHALARTRGAGRLAALIAALAVAVGTLPFVSPRPQMLTYCLLLALCLALERDHVWAAPAIVALGVNLHGGVYPLYLVVVAAYVLPKRWPVLLASAGAVLLNPAGAALLALPFRSLLDPNTVAIAEFAPTALARHPFNLVAYLGVVVLLAVRRPRIPARDGALALAVTLLSLTALRHVALFYVLVLPLLAPYLGPTDRAGSRLPRPERLLVPALAATALAALVVTASQPPRPIDAGYPKAAAAYIKTHGVTRVANVWQDGGYLMFNGVPPFIDGRGDPFVPSSTGGPDVVTDYARAFGLKGDWTALARKYRLEHVLVGKTMPFYRALQHSAVAEVEYEDADFALFELDVR